MLSLPQRQATGSENAVIGFPFVGTGRQPCAAARRRRSPSALPWARPVSLRCTQPLDQAATSGATTGGVAAAALLAELGGIPAGVVPLPPVDVRSTKSPPPAADDPPLEAPPGSASPVAPSPCSAPEIAPVVGVGVADGPAVTVGPPALGPPDAGRSPPVNTVMAATPTARSSADATKVARAREMTTGALRACLPAMGCLGS